MVARWPVLTAAASCNNRRQATTMARLKCPECGARTPVPSSGLTMTCAYCGFSQPVPDADKRRERMERAERKRREAEEAARRRAAQRAAGQAQERVRRGIGCVGALLRLVAAMLPLAAIAAVLYHFGLLDPLIGETGEQQLAEAAAELRQRGYVEVQPPRVERYFARPSQLYADMRRGRCYALALGAPKPLTRVRLHGSPGSIRRPNRLVHALGHCPERDITRRVTVTLDGWGRFSWALYARPAPAAKPRRSRRVKTRRAKGRPGRRRSGRLPRDSNRLPKDLPAGDPPPPDDIVEF
jgi:uncharacterized Zn finger protein (UPF0148 family)